MRLHAGRGSGSGNANQSPLRTQTLGLGAFEQLAPCALRRRSSSMDCWKWPFVLGPTAGQLPEGEAPGGDAPGGEPALTHSLEVLWSCPKQHPCKARC